MNNLPSSSEIAQRGFNQAKMRKTLETMRSMNSELDGPISRLRKATSGLRKSVRDIKIGKLFDDEEP